MDFENKRVLITGSSRGIGYGIAEAFIESGARVAIHGKTPESVNAAMDKLGQKDQLVAAPGDIGKVAGCQLAVKTAVEALGGLDILVNSAGIGAGRPIDECDEQMWDDHVDVNLKGLFFTCQAALPELRKSKGNIVNISSDAGLIGVPGIVVYCGSKGGVVMMARAMALEEAPNGVRVNSVCPGYVDTDMIRLSAQRKPDPEAAWQKMVDYAPLKRIASTAEIAAAVQYLASVDARFITGIALPIDGGTTAGK
jgi:NAD(P)-dependent dehydrogenase (short-subunit alcohol dehydrogenase family)